MDYKGVVCVIVASVLANVYGNYIEDYCWRDYDGSIPSDALKAGTDSNGKSVYIGQTLVFNKLIPGKVIENVSKRNTMNETKILCTEYPEKFIWLKTRLDHILYIKNKHSIFEGGYERGYSTYVGRVKTTRDMLIFEVICSTNTCSKLILKGNVFNNDENFEILTYSESGINNSASSLYNEKRFIELAFTVYTFLILVTKTFIY